MKKLKTNYDQLVREALARVETIAPVAALDLAKEPGVVIIDVRDVREMQRDGCIPGSYHAPRGLVESWADPESEYFKPVFGENHTFLICCASGRRSALVADVLGKMGMTGLVNMSGGFATWKLLGGDVCDYADGRHIDLFDPKDQLVEL